MMTRSTMTAISPIASLPLSRGGRVTQGSRARVATATGRAGCHHASVTKRRSHVLGLTVVLISLLALGSGCGPAPPMRAGRWTAAAGS